jgi:1-acyl-sn-glycerol-3-phosphate acyltransferase
MNRTQAAWLVGRPTFGALVKLFTPLRTYGRDRIPAHGPLVLCFNHFSWLDPWALGSVIPRTVYYVAKQEAHDTPLMGPFIRFFGTSSIRRGESDREAIRVMKDVVRRGDTLGMFPEGTRQKSEPGEVRTGAALIAVQEQVPVLCGAIEGTQRWKLGNFEPVSLAFGRPLDVSGFPRNSQGYRAASQAIQAEIRRQWEFLVKTMEQGRPRVAIPPA